MKNVFLCMLKLFLILINVDIFAIVPDLTAPFFFILPCPVFPS